MLVFFLDDALWSGDTKLTKIVDKLRLTFHIGAERTQIFDYIGISLEQNNDFSITIHSLLHLMHAVARTHASTCTTSFMCEKNSTCHFCL